MSAANTHSYASASVAGEETLKPGDMLLRGQYRIDRYLNSGGFGITYLAHDSLDRKVVIKECFPNTMCSRTNANVMARSRSMQKDFERVVKHFGLEARRLSKLHHPNIVGVHQVFEDYGTAYMALDFVEGRDLQDILETERERLTPEIVKAMLSKLLDAIQYMHDQDVLHRDISPDNILVDANWNPVLIDFGAAREVASSASRMLSTLQVVKDGYSPQEFYLANNNQSPSSDLYSLAATFYHVITGKAPPNSQVRLAALASDDPDPYVPLPPRTEGYDHYFLGAIDKALAVFPRDRLRSANDWADEIDQARRQKALRDRAMRDEALDMAIRELTLETNRALMEVEAQKPAESAAPPAAAAAAPVKGPSADMRDESFWEDDDDEYLFADMDAEGDVSIEEVFPPIRDSRSASSPDTVQGRQRSLLLRLILSPALLFSKRRADDASDNERAQH